MKIINRPAYLDRLIRFKDKQIIKVITGVRRSGKSTLIELYIDYLKQNGVEDNQIIHLNLENPKYSTFESYLDLYNYIKDKMVENKMNYIFIDEVQLIKDFEKAIDGLFILKNADVCVTGSNAYMLSSDLATLLSGRYIEIKMMPLSFAEYVSSFDNENDLQTKFQNYIEFGSFPYILNFENELDKKTYLEGIYNTILLKDVATRLGTRDIEQLERVLKFSFDSIGSVVSPRNIANTLKSAGKTISSHTIDSYIQAFTDSYVLYQANRYDVKGKELLSTGSKYYVVDTGLRYYLLGGKQVDRGHILENIVYLELLRRGYQVYVGKSNENEIDFVANKDGITEYYQVAWTVDGYDSNGKPTLDRELKPLTQIKDFNARYLLTMDMGGKISHNGIQQINVINWLLNK